MAQRPIDLATSLAHVRAGGLPIRAQMRLAEEAGPHRRLFTSDLSVSEFLLVEEAKARPISQVMGSSIYHIGVVSDYKGGGEKVFEITTISEGHREARRCALSRLFQEARIVNADAVVGVRIRERMIAMGNHGKGGDDGGEVIEFTAVGTAIEAPWITHPPSAPVVTDLSGQELWALAQDGFEPCGFLFDFCRYHVWHVLADQYQIGRQELALAQQAIDAARVSVERRILAKANEYDAEFVVGSDVKITVREVPCGYAKCELNDVDVDVSWFGTAIRRIPSFTPPAHPNVPPLILSMMPLGRRKDDVFDEDDDEDEVEELAREAEEEALEADDEDEDDSE
jgi:uncharacterized protein YbjQ (UPF0145 family)